MPNFWNQGGHNELCKCEPHNVCPFPNAQVDKGVVRHSVRGGLRSPCGPSGGHRDWCVADVQSVQDVLPRGQHGTNVSRFV